MAPRRHRDRKRMLQRRRPKVVLKKKIFTDELDLLSIRDTNHHYSVIAKKHGGIQTFFMTAFNFNMHAIAQREHRERYIVGLLLGYRHRFIRNYKCYSYALAAALTQHDTELVKALLSWHGVVKLPEVVRAVGILDIGRQLRAGEKRVKRLEMSGYHLQPSQKPTKDVVRRLKKIRPKIGTASGAVCKHIKRWVRDLTEAELRQYIEDADTSRTNWRILADICHFHPEKDFPSLPWFLPYMFDEKKLPPEEKKEADRFADLRALNINERIQTEEIPFHRISESCLQYCLTAASKLRLVSYSSLETIASNFSHLACAEINDVLVERLSNDGIFMAEDGAPLVGDLLHIVNDLLNPELHGTGLMDEIVFNETEEGLVASSQPVQVYKGTEILECAIQHIDQRLKAARVAVRTVLESPIHIIPNVGEEKPLHFFENLLVLGALAMVTEGQLYGFSEENLHDPKQSASELVEWAKTEYEQFGTYSGVAASVNKLCEERTVVPVIFLVQMLDYPLMDSQENDPIVRALERYCKEVYPALIVFIDFPFFTTPFIRKMVKKGLRVAQLSMAKAYTPGEMEPVDRLLAHLTSSKLPFKTVDEQAAHMIELLKRDGFQTTWDKFASSKL